MTEEEIFEQIILYINKPLEEYFEQNSLQQIVIDSFKAGKQYDCKVCNNHVKSNFEESALQLQDKVDNLEVYILRLEDQMKNKQQYVEFLEEKLHNLEAEIDKIPLH